MILRRVRDTPQDATTVRTLAQAAFAASDAAKGDSPPPQPTAADNARRERVVRHLTGTDPDGSWLAEDSSGRPVGVAMASLREGTWALSLLAVLPDAQGKGAGTALLRQAMDYGRGTLRGIICGSRHPLAARAYRQAGFDLHPAMRLSGPVDPAGLSVPDGPAVAGGLAHCDLMDSVDRRVRGGAHGPDHPELLRHYQAVVCDDLAGSGYCYVNEEGRVELLAATSRRIATRLLTAALASLPAGTVARVSHLTAQQQWAVDVGLAAGLELTTVGYVCVRGMRPPQPYLPSGAFL